MANVSLKRYRDKKTRAKSRCIISMKLALPLIPPFPMPGKSPVGSLNCQRCDMGASMS